MVRLAEDRQVTLDLIYRPHPIDWDRDVVARLVLQVPERTAVEWPEPMADRFEGFDYHGAFDDDPDPTATGLRYVRHLRLTPVAGELQRLAPMPLRLIDTSEGSAGESWIATMPLRWPTVALPDPPEEHVFDSEPLAVRPSWRSLMLRSLAGMLTVAAFLAVALLAHRLWRRAHPPPSPHDLAIRELARLLARDDIAQGRFKEFYIGLTLIVRRYIERRHGIHAPEQTTPEFLDAASRHPAFPPPILDALRCFLEAADAVKFAAHPADPQTATDAVRAARDYIETDAVRQPERLPC